MVVGNWAAKIFKIVQILSLKNEVGCNFQAYSNELIHNFFI